MKTILLMRHSYAMSNNPAFADCERPLTDHGQKLAVRTGALLNEFEIETVIHSSAIRTTETAQLICERQTQIPRQIATQDLYLAPAQNYVSSLTEHCLTRDRTVLVVGHNPGIAELIWYWSGQSFAVTPGTVAIFVAEANDWREVGEGGRHSPELVGLISEGSRQAV